MAKQRKRLTNQVFSGLKARRRGRPSALSSRLVRRVTQLKQKAVAQRGSPSAGMLRRRGAPRAGARSENHMHGRQSVTGENTYEALNICTHTYVQTHMHTQAQTHTHLYTTPNLSADPASGTQQDWTANQDMRRRRGRRPKVQMGAAPTRVLQRGGGASEKLDVNEGAAGNSESSAQGECVCVCVCTWCIRSGLQYSTRVLLEQLR